MKLILITVAIAFLGPSLSAREPESVSKEDLISSYREFRQAASKFMAGMTAMYESASFSSKKTEKELIAERDQNYRLARPHIDKSIKLNPFYSPAYEMRAVILRDTEEKLELAIQDFTKAIELEPEFESAIVARGEIFVRLGKVEDARRDLATLEQRKSPRANELRAGIERSEQDGADHPPTTLESKPEGKEKPKSDTEGQL